MSRFLNRCGCWLVGLGMAVVPLSAPAFSMLGPQESWQDINIGYERHNYVWIPDGSLWDVHGNDFAWHPHNFGEGFRWNNPVLYYSYDQTFLDYFGADGVAAVDAAVALFNNLTNVSAYSTDLHEIPLEESRINYTASALHLFDLKSTVMELLVERLGLVDPERWAWTIHTRVLPPGLVCPHFQYSVVQRNFDPFSIAPSRYVNGNLYTYEIEQSCPPGEDFGDAVEYLVDPNGTTYSALATPKLMLPDATFYGWFHTGLTRDDIGGLRYLYATNALANEGAGTNAVTFVTDTLTTNLLYTSNLTTLAAQALTNNAAALQALYPNLSIASTTPIFTNTWITNYTAYFTNYSYDSYPTPPHVAYLTNRTQVIQTWYHHTFNNVVTFQQQADGTWLAVPLPDITTHVVPTSFTVQTTVVTNSPWLVAGSAPITNSTSFTFPTNDVAGEYFILASNLCGVAITKLQWTIQNFDTNVVASATNAPAGFTNSQFFSQVIIRPFNQDVFQINPILCPSNTVALRQGIEKVTFIRRDYDYLLGQFYSPVVNNYTLTAVSNKTVVVNGITNVTRILLPQRVQRVVNQPDILFSAADLLSGFPSIPTVLRTAPSFDIAGATVAQPLPANAVPGPGNVRGTMNFQFNKVGPVYVNGTYPLFVDEAGALLNFAWGSYDATTNAPIVYPTGTSISNLETQVLLQISPPGLPDGLTNVAYSAQLQVTAATPDWQGTVTWSLAAGSPALPSGLTLNAATGLISGTPNQVGFYNFVVRATDAKGHTTQQSYLINVFEHL